MPRPEDCMGSLQNLWCHRNKLVKPIEHSAEVAWFHWGGLVSLHLSQQSINRDKRARLFWGELWGLLLQLFNWTRWKPLRSPKPWDVRVSVALAGATEVCFISSQPHSFCVITQRRGLIEQVKVNLYLTKLLNVQGQDVGHAIVVHLVK